MDKMVQAAIRQNRETIKGMANRFLIKANARKHQIFAQFRSMQQHIIAHPGVWALDFMHAQSNLLKKVSGSHVSKEGNKPHAILMVCSISDKNSYATIAPFLLSE
jgi:hypothetical protein